MVRRVGRNFALLGIDGIMMGQENMAFWTKGWDRYQSVFVLQSYAFMFPVPLPLIDLHRAW